jgi:hypothetical protein
VDIFEDAKAILHSRKRAYETTFNPEGVDQQIVLADLAEFCRANKPTFDADPRVHALLEGRREVWLRIQKYLQMTPDELWEVTQRKG